MAQVGKQPHGGLQAGGVVQLKGGQLKGYPGWVHIQIGHVAEGGSDIPRIQRNIPHRPQQVAHQCGCGCFSVGAGNSHITGVAQHTQSNLHLANNRNAGLARSRDGRSIGRDTGTGHKQHGTRYTWQIVKTDIACNSNRLEFIGRTQNGVAARHVRGVDARPVAGKNE
jgi:hypothetical protein